MAGLLWRSTKGYPLARVMIIALVVLGAVITNNHLFAPAYGAISLYIARLGFIVVLFYAIGRGILELPVSGAILLAVLALPAAWGMSALFEMIPGMSRSSVIYGPFALVFGMLALILRGHAPETSWRMAVAGLWLLLALPIRSLDLKYCGFFPHGTHFLWHILIALEMGWLIHTYRRHMLAHRDVQG
ncbi:hypothetical protein [Pseudoprimorskyibacter insulae]|nr:hypothetical protein [Pseudoprimorskyibacter insulae]